MKDDRSDVTNDIKMATYGAEHPWKAQFRPPISLTTLTLIFRIIQKNNTKELWKIRAIFTDGWRNNFTYD